MYSDKRFDCLRRWPMTFDKKHIIPAAILMKAILRFSKGGSNLLNIHNTQNNNIYQILPESW